jgi:Tol biopolymer transport system component
MSGRVLIALANFAVGLCGIAAAQPTTRISVDADGKEADKASSYPVISVDGRYVAFVSEATNLVTGGNGGKRQVYVHDRVAGMVTMVSKKADGTIGDGHSDAPGISTDGRYVVFSTAATNLVAGDTNGVSDIIWLDRDKNGDGNFNDPELKLVTRKHGGGASNGLSGYPTVSGDGKKVAFHSRAKNLTNPAWGDGTVQAFVYEVGTDTMTPVSVKMGDATKPGNGHSRFGAISADGKFVAFDSEATDLVAGDANEKRDVFRRDLAAGATVLVSVAGASTQGDDVSQYPTISGNGNIVCFQSNAKNLVANDGNGMSDVFARDVTAGTLKCISVKADGKPGAAASAWVWASLDGKWAVFHSGTADLVDPPTNGKSHVFLREIAPGRTRLVSISSGDQLANDANRQPSVSGDWAFVAFQSAAKNLVGARDSGGPTDGNGVEDIFVHDVDEDKDGLPNVWEVNGVDINFDGTKDLDLAAKGCKVDHKDLLLELDTMTSEDPGAGPIADVVAAFAAAPNSLVQNPDGANGIHLVLERDDTDIPDAAWDSSTADAWSRFDAVKKHNDHGFGTDTERGHANKVFILRAKARVYHYGIVAQQILDGGTSGIAELPGNDFMVTLGRKDGSGAHVWERQRGQFASTIMHEFGHTLGLRHGGHDVTNQKPNYHSIMSYTWQMPTKPGLFGSDANKAKFASSWRLDYSRRAFAAMEEDKLNENNGVGGDTGNWVPVGPLLSGGGRIGKIVPESGRVDFDRNGKIEATAAADLNKAWSTAHSAGTTEKLEGHEDWSKLRYAVYGITIDGGKNARNYSDGADREAEGASCLGDEGFYEINHVGWCLADYNADLELDSIDVVYFLNDHQAGVMRTDYNEDGVLNSLDVLDFLNLWTAGCTHP